MPEGNTSFSLSGDMTLTIGLGLVVLFLLFVFFNKNNSGCATREGLNNVPLNLSGAMGMNSHTFAPWAGYAAPYGPYNTPRQFAADKLDLETQQKRGHKTNRFLPAIGKEFHNYMNLDERKMSTPYYDEYDMPGDQWYPKPINNDYKYGRGNGGCPCASETSSEVPPPSRKNGKKNGNGH